MKSLAKFPLVQSESAVLDRSESAAIACIRLSCVQVPQRRLSSLSAIVMH